MRSIPILPTEPVYGIPFVPYQPFQELYPVNQALWHGTIFRELDIPFEAYAKNPLMNPFIRS